MLEAHQTAWEHPEQKVRSFDEIAVLCRTHHQAELVEKCLRTESIPYVIAGREDYLNEESVQNSLSFFRLIEQTEESGSRRRRSRKDQRMHGRAKLRMCPAAFPTFPG